VKRAGAAALLTLAGVCFGASRATLSSSRYLDHVKYLASDELGGRGTGTAGLEKAARYLAARYKALGLEPAFGDSYLQPFTVTMNAKLGSKNRLSDTLNKDKFKAIQDFVPFNFSSSGRVTAPVVFAGYGITASEYGYDDYAGLDVTGKIVLVLRYEPQEYDDKSVFEGRVYTRHAQFDSKAINAKMHGAKAVILINNPVTHAGDNDRLETFGRTAGPSEAGIPMVQMKPAAARLWMEAAGRSMQEIVEGIDKDLKPRSFAFPDSLKATIEVDLIRETKTVYNVAGVLRGSTDEYLVIGAHYDHLGLGEQFSLAPSQVGKVHPGADDNASGVAGVLELAAAFSGQRPRRGIVFANFAGEEIGLLGSSYFTEHPPAPIEKCSAMLNMDMIGRMKDGAVIIGGAGTAADFKPLLDEEARRFPKLKLEYNEQSGVGSSDHTSFTAKRVPVLFFFTGLHGDYHRPSDTWDKINADGAVELLDLVGDIANQLAESPARPEFVKVADPPKPSGSGGGGSGGYGPSFGSIPDMAFSGPGVKFSDLREGSPAAKAGLKAGDVMVEFDGKKIDNLYDFTYALRGKQPGDEVSVKVLRGGTPYTVQVKLEARN
jgi:aminopeptidase YwaD